MGAGKVETFSQLRAGESLRIRFTSGGCFHFYTYDLTFEVTDGARVSVTSVELDWSQADRAYHDGTKANLGELSLSSADLAGLDALLAFYRTTSGGGCTKKDKIEICQLRDGHVIAREEFADGSCAASKVSGVLTIPALAHRLAPPLPGS